MTNNSFSILTLQERLEKLKIPKECYSLGKYKEEALCLEKTQNAWIIYEGERGNRYNLENYENETGACIAFLEKIENFI